MLRKPEIEYVLHSEKIKKHSSLKRLLDLNFYFPACQVNVIWLIGDGYCDDSSNSEQCDFDGGDCCLDQIVAACYECMCYADGTRHPEEKGTQPTRASLKKSPTESLNHL